MESFLCLSSSIFGLFDSKPHHPFLRPKLRTSPFLSRTALFCSWYVAGYSPTNNCMYILYVLSFFVHYLIFLNVPLHPTTFHLSLPMYFLRYPPHFPCSCQLYGFVRCGGVMNYGPKYTTRRSKTSINTRNAHFRLFAARAYATEGLPNKLPQPLVWVNDDENDELFQEPSQAIQFQYIELILTLRVFFHSSSHFHLIQNLCHPLLLICHSTSNSKP